MKLTQRIADTIAFDPKQSTLWDDDVPGFGLRLYESGKRSWIIRYRVGNKKRYYTIAGAHLMNLRDARDKAREILYKLSQGEDPFAVRQSARAQATFKELTARYLKDRAPLKKTEAAERNRIKNSFPPRWDDRKAIAITRGDIKELHLQLGQRGHYTANRTVELISAVFEFGREIEMIPEDHTNPTRGVTHFPERSRERFLSKDEMQRLFEALENDDDPYTRVYFSVLLMTGMRSGELLLAQWDDINRDTQSLMLPETKSGKAQWVPLSDPALALIDSLPRTSSPYLFPGRDTSRPRSPLRKPWKRICKAAGLKAGRDGFTVHDLRRSFGSWLTQNGTDLNTVRHLLRHSSISTTMIYARLLNDAGRDAVNHLGDTMANLTSPERRAS